MPIMFLVAATRRIERNSPAHHVTGPSCNQHLEKDARLRATAAAAGEASGVDEPVVGQCRCRDAVDGDGGPKRSEHRRADRAYREWSSSQVTISASVPSASR